MARIRRPIRCGRRRLPRHDPDRHPGERRAVPALRDGRQRQGPGRPHGHQGPEGGQRRRPRAVDTGHEGRIPAPRYRGQEGLRGAPPRGTGPHARDLHPRPVRGRARPGRRGASRRARPQAAGPLHDRRLHLRGVRRHLRGEGDPDRGHRVGGCGRGDRRRPLGGAGRPREHQLPARPGRSHRRQRPSATRSSTSGPTRSSSTSRSGTPTGRGTPSWTGRMLRDSAKGSRRAARSVQHRSSGS